MHLGGVIIHSAIFYALAIALTFPSSIYNGRFAFWLFAVFISHILIDKVKLIFGKTVIQKEFINFIIDQCIHVAVLSTVYLIPFNGNFISFVVNKSTFSGLSNSALSVILFVASMLIFVSYAISVLLYYYDCSVSKDPKSLKYNYSRMLYRSILFLLLISPYFPIAIVLIIANYVYTKKILKYDLLRFIIEKVYLILLVFVFFLGKGVLI